MTPEKRPHLKSDTKPKSRRPSRQDPIAVGAGRTKGSRPPASVLPQNITNLRQAQSALLASEEKFRLMVESVQDYAIFALDAEGRVATWNKGAQRIKGYTAGEITGKPIATFYTQEDCRNGKPDTLLSAARRQGRVEDEGWRVRRDGSRFWANVVITALRDGTGSVRGFVKVTRDMTERRAAEESLRRANDELEARVEGRTRELAAANAFLGEMEKELRVITNALPVLISYIDAEHRYRFNNQSYTDWFGGTAESLRGRHTRDVLGEKAYDAIRPRLERALAGQRVEFDSLLPYKTGDRYVHVVYIPDTDNAGKTKGLFVLVNDISERRQTEERIQALNAELEKKVLERTEAMRIANHELESFSYSVSHDLRAPLRSIDGFSQAILEDCADKLGPKDKEYFQRIRAASQRMAKLIDDLLDLSRLSRKELRQETLDLSALAQNVVDDLRRANPARAVEIAIEPGLKASGDAGLMRTVLQNLLENAWKFTGRTEAPRVVFGRKDMDGERVFYVQDNGAGFDMAHANKLFGPFQRLHGVEEFPGTGVGLASVHRAIRRHGGRVWAEAAPGRGATFFFTLEGALSPAANDLPPAVPLPPK